MADLTTWSEFGRWILVLTRRLIPDRIIRWAWNSEKVLNAIHAFHFDGAPQFCVGENRESYELEIAGFNIFNFSPFKFEIVGVSLQVQLDSTTLLKIEKRYPTTTAIPAYGRSGFYYDSTLTSRQAEALREYSYTPLRIQISGAVILQSAFGELQKKVNASVLAEVKT